MLRGSGRVGRRRSMTAAQTCWATWRTSPPSSRVRCSCFQGVRRRISARINRSRGDVLGLDRRARRTMQTICGSSRLSSSPSARASPRLTRASKSCRSLWLGLVIGLFLIEEFLDNRVNNGVGQQAPHVRALGGYRAAGQGGEEEGGLEIPRPVTAGVQAHGLPGAAKLDDNSIRRLVRDVPAKSPGATRTLNHTE